MKDKELFGMPSHKKETKYIRTKVVDPYKLKKYREKQFAGKRTMKDEYEGKVVHSQTINARRKYLSKYNFHTNNVDHVVSAKEIHEKTAYNYFVSEKKIKELVNRDENFAIAVGHLNQSKGDESIKEFIKKHPELDEQTKEKLLKADKEARKMLRREITKSTLEGIGETAVEGVKAGAIYKGTYASIDNAIAFCNGEKELGEAISDTLFITAKSAAKSGCNRVLDVGAQATTQWIIDKIDNKLPIKEKLKKVIDNKYTGVIITIGDEVVTLTTQLTKGNITFDEYKDQLVDKTVEVAIVYQIGCITGPYGLVVSAAVNYVSTKVLKALGEWADNLDTKEKREKRIAQYRILAKRAEEESRVLIKILENAEKNYVKDTESVLEKLKNAYATKDIGMYSQGIEELCQCYNIEPVFESTCKMKEFMLASQKSIILGDEIKYSYK